MPSILLMNSYILGSVHKPCLYITSTCSMILASCWKPLCDLYVVHAVFHGPSCAMSLCKTELGYGAEAGWGVDLPAPDVHVASSCCEQWMERSARLKLLFQSCDVPSFSIHHLFLEIPELTKHLLLSLRIICLLLEIHCVLSSVGPMAYSSQAEVWELAIAFFQGLALGQAPLVFNSALYFHFFLLN